MNYMEGRTTLGTSGQGGLKKRMIIAVGLGLAAAISAACNTDPHGYQVPPTVTPFPAVPGLLAPQAVVRA